MEKTFKTFSPKDYLYEYYIELGPEEDNLLKFFIYAYNYIPQRVKILEFGGGPTLYQLITAITKAKEVYFSDYLESNLNEIKKWILQHPDAFSWDTYIERVLYLEGKSKFGKEDIQKRKLLLLKKIKKFLFCDAFKADPLGEKYRGFFDVVSSNFTSESISKNKKQWKQTLENISTLIKPEGYFIMTALKEAKYWHMGNKKFPATYINEEDIFTALKKIGFKKNKIDIQSFSADTIDENGQGKQGFNGVICVIAQKNK